MRKNAVKTSLVSICLLLCLALTGMASESTDVQKWHRSSLKGAFLVDLIATEPGIGLNQFHTWRLVIRDANSKQAVVPVRVVIGGGMPAHGHGLPTRPQVTEHLGDGQYKVEGLIFNMAGSWQLIFDINTHEQADRAVFDLTIEH